MARYDRAIGIEFPSPLEAAQLVILSDIQEFVLVGKALQQFALMAGPCLPHPDAEKFLLKWKAIVGFKCAMVNPDSPRFLGIFGGRVWVGVDKVIPN